MSERPVDHAWDALVEVTQANVAQERGALNRALSQIRAITSDLDISDEELALLVRHHANLYREVFPSMPLTANALAKWWSRLEDEAQRLRALEAEKASELEERRKTRGVNVHVHNDCTICGGDGYVLVGTIPPVQTIWMAEHGIALPDRGGHDQTAPCPVCNTHAPVLKSFWDGRAWTFGSFPGEVTIS
jgi:uncharacterized phage protein gp47/JayE